MQAVAQAQAHERAGEPVDSYPFATLAVWRDKVQDDLTAAGAAGGPGYKLRLLLQQGKDVEQGVLGCLKDSLFDLHEGVAWGLLSPEFESQQRQQLLNAAANELHTDKQLCLQLAREHGILEEYAAQVKKPQHHTVSDYERVGELKFGLLVWRANLKRDASLASDGQELEKQLADAYTDALRLIKRCGTRSLQYWSAQQAASAPSPDSKQRLYKAAVQRVQNMLLELAEAHTVDKASLQRLFQEVSDPEAVGEAEGQEEGEGEEGGSAEAPAAAGPRWERDRATRGSSEESESSALGL